MDFVWVASFRACSGLSVCSGEDWAATSLYYSIVHTARLLVFLACGDYPTGHTQLPECFNGTHPISTSWLSKFLKQRNLPRAQHYAVEVDAGRMRSFWTSVSVVDAVSKLHSLASALRMAKELRNDNNYESLLIAHEYRHVGVTVLFLRLATAMRVLSRNTLSIGAQCFAAYMKTRSPREQSFIVRYCQKRILEPIGEWHSGVVCSEVEIILRDTLSLDATDDIGATKIDLATSRTYFNEKDGLMNEFQRKITDLEALVR